MSILVHILQVDASIVLYHLKCTGIYQEHHLHSDNLLTDIMVNTVWLDMLVGRVVRIIRSGSKRKGLPNERYSFSNCLVL